MATTSTVYSILRKQVNARLLDGYLTDVMDEDNGRFYALTFNTIDLATYHQYEFAHSGFTRSSCGADEEKTRVYSDDGNTYTVKDTQRCIQEGVYHAFSIKFYGCLFEGWWYIQTELTFWGEHVSEDYAKELLTSGVADKTVLTSEVYLPIGAYFPEMDGVEKLSRGPEMLEFLGMPWLAAYRKQEEKLELCRAFSRLFNAEIFLPFKNRLIVTRFEEFEDIIPLYSQDFTLIFPVTRDYVLIPAMRKCNQHEFSVCYFFWHQANRKMYQWTYFPHDPSGFNYHYAVTVITHLAQISSWNNIRYLQSSCTMDDEGFWADHVLAQEAGRYKYLVEISC